MNSGERGWRDDLYAIGALCGRSFRGRKDAARVLAGIHGIEANAWREALCDTAAALGFFEVSGWREALRLVRLCCEGELPIGAAPLHLYDSAGRALYDNGGRALYVRR